jgi:hypothetical protein
MKPSEKSKLIGKFWEGNTTRTEEEKLFGDVPPEGLNKHDEAYFRFITEARKVYYSREDEIWKTIISNQHRKKRYLYMASAIAASFILFVSLYVMTSTIFKDKRIEPQLTFNNTTHYFDAFGIDKSTNPTLYINGCKSSADYHTAIQTINPSCIQHVNLTRGDQKSGKPGNQNGTVEVWLKGKSDELFSVCEGTLYFYQDGEIKSILINDDCSPNLLVDCREVPLSEIAELKPQQIKSIELTTNPRNCSGQLSGEFIVLESK